MPKGKVIIHFEYDEVKQKCSWDLTQEGKNPLNNDDLILLFQHIIGEFMFDK